MAFKKYFAAKKNCVEKSSLPEIERWHFGMVNTGSMWKECGHRSLAGSVSRRDNPAGTVQYLALLLQDVLLAVPGHWHTRTITLKLIVYNLYVIKITLLVFSFKRSYRTDNL